MRQMEQQVKKQASDPTPHNAQAAEPEQSTTRADTDEEQHAHMPIDPHRLAGDFEHCRERKDIVFNGIASPQQIKDLLQGFERLSATPLGA
jgi:hypothetical protein